MKVKVTFEFDEKEIFFNREILKLLIYSKGFAVSENIVKIESFSVVDKIGYQETISTKQRNPKS